MTRLRPQVRIFLGLQYWLLHIINNFIKKKRLKMNQKTCFFIFCLLFKAGWHAKEQKRSKTAEKRSLTSFQVRAAPESWLKYTTIGGPFASLDLLHKKKKNMNKMLLANVFGPFKNRTIQNPDQGWPFEERTRLVFRFPLSPIKYNPKWWITLHASEPKKYYYLIV